MQVRRNDEDIEHFWFFHVKVFTQNNFSTIFVILSVNEKVFVNVTLKIDANTTTTKNITTLFLNQ